MRVNFDFFILFLFFISQIISENVVWIWQISDVHLDLLYKENADPNCNIEGACCRDINPHQTSYAGKYGSFDNKGWCGIPTRTFEGVLDFVNEQSELLGIEKFTVVYTGDQSGQDASVQTVKENYDILNTVYDLLGKKFDGKVFPSIGNHDTWPEQHMDLHSSFLGWHFDQWEKWLTSEVLEEAKINGGYYSMLLEEGFRIVSLNTNWNNRWNEWMIVNTQKRSEMLKWLDETLANAERSGERVVMIGHVPPGMAGNPGKGSYNFDEYENDFGVVCGRYNQTIVAHLVGHEHTSRFGLVTAPGVSESSIVYFPTGSVLNSHGESCFQLVNPSVRLYEFRADYEFELFDFRQWYNDLNVSNALKDFSKGWNPLFSMRYDFGMTDLSTKSFESLVNEFETNSELFQKYVKYYTSNFGNYGCEPSECDDTCKKFMICQMRYSNHDEFEGCMYNCLKKG